MTKEETQIFNQVMINIANNKKRTFVETDKDEHTAMVPLGEVLAELRKFVNFVKSKANIKSS